MSQTNPLLPLAETLQTLSLNRHPSPSHDLNPSTSASSKQPVTVSSPHSSPPHSDETGDGEYSTIRPVRRKAALPPLPDLRFEQSYLASIRSAQEESNYILIAYITIRDQVFLPLLQGTLWTLLLSGWRFWNRSANLSGRSAGSRIRRWWWGVNNWKIPAEGFPEGGGKGMGDDRKLAGEVGEYYTAEFSSAGME